MKRRNTLKEFIVLAYKFSVFAINYLLFIVGFSLINPSLLKLGRHSVLSLFVYCLSLLLLLPIFRNFDIGYRKSKPVFFSTAVVYIITLFTLYMTQIILTAKLPLFKAVVGNGMLLLIPILLLQILILYILTHIGNNIYFKVYDKSNTLILYKDPTHLNPIKDYVMSHDKQYRLIDVIQIDDNIDIPSNTDTIILVGIDSSKKANIYKYAFMNSVDVLYTASITDVLSGKTNSTVIDDILLIESKALNMSLVQRFMKRTIDILFSVILLLISLPIFILIFILIKLDDGGPVFFKQERLTINGKIFNIIKFRSMKIDAGSAPAIENDSRITKIGSVLRKLRIDEIPQFINILLGDMSVVGPRPESVPIMDVITEDLPEFSYRLKAKAGLTGYAQIFGKYNTSPEQKLILDLKYIVNYSVANDIKLILQTINVFFDANQSTTGYSDDDKRLKL